MCWHDFAKVGIHERMVTCDYIWIPQPTIHVLIGEGFHALSQKQLKRNALIPATLFENCT